MRRVLLFVGPALSSALLSSETSEMRLRSLSELVLLFRGDGDGPDESEQFAPDRRHNLVLVLASCRHRLVAFVQPLLRLPGDLFGLLANRQRLLSAEKEADHIR